MSAVSITRCDGRVRPGYLRVPRTDGLRAGNIVGTAPYRVRSRVCEGGMGEIFEVEHVGLERIALLKVLRAGLADRPDAAERLRTEARLLAALGPPITPAVYDAGLISSWSGSPGATSGPS
jgi:eukaryotic-like serine/threonine-protein kinase